MLQQSPIAKSGRRAAGEAKLLFGGSGDGDIGFDATAGDQALSVNSAAYRNVYVIGADLLKKRQGVGPTEVKFSKRRELQQRHLIAHRKAFALRCRPPVLRSVAWGNIALVVRLCKPERAFPATVTPK